MARTAAAGALLALILATGCPRNEPELATPLEEEEGSGEAQLLSTVNAADPAAEEQLLEGFHTVEQRAWRWVEKRFSLLLQPPPPAPGQLASLDLRFTIPEVIEQRVGPVTLSATVNGVALGAETFEAAGEHLYTREVPEGALTEAPARVEFEVDKAMPPSDQDSRELAIVVQSIALR